MVKIYEEGGSAIAHQRTCLQDKYGYTINVYFNTRTRDNIYTANAIAQLNVPLDFMLKRTAFIQ